MAGFTYEQNFDGMSTGNLNGQDSWTYIAGNQPQVTTSEFESSPNSVSCDVGANINTRRDITAVNTDNSIYYFSIKASTTSSVDNAGLQFANGATHIATVYINAPNAGDISLRDPINGDYTNLMTGALTTVWYRIGVEFDFANDRVRANVNNGTMSAWNTMNAFTQVNRLVLEGNNGDAGTLTAYFDNFSATYSTGGGGGGSPAPTLEMMGVGA